MRRDGETREQQIGRAVGQVGPSMLLTSLSESLAFFLGTSSCISWVTLLVVLCCVILHRTVCEKKTVFSFRSVFLICAAKHCQWDMLHLPHWRYLYFIGTMLSINTITILMHLIIIKCLDVVLVTEKKRMQPVLSASPAVAKSSLFVALKLGALWACDG